MSDSEDLFMSMWGADNHPQHPLVYFISLSVHDLLSQVLK